MPPRVPPELRTALNPFIAALTDVAKKAITAAVDAALEDVEERVEDVKQRVSSARRKVRRRSKRDDAIVIEAGPKRRRPRE
jgi:hypothetical protein